MYILKSAKVFDIDKPTFKVTNDIEKLKSMLRGVPVVINELPNLSKYGKTEIIGFIQGNVQECAGSFYANIILRTNEHKDKNFDSFEIILNEDKVDIKRFGNVRRIVAVLFK